MERVVGTFPVSVACIFNSIVLGCAVYYIRICKSLYSTILGLVFCNIGVSIQLFLFVLIKSRVIFRKR